MITLYLVLVSTQVPNTYINRNIHAPVVAQAAWWNNPNLCQRNPGLRPPKIIIFQTSADAEISGVKH